MTTNAATTADPLASFAAPPAWPLMPALPSPPSELDPAYNVSSSLGYATWNQTGVGDCTSSAQCELFPNYFTFTGKHSSIGVNSLVLNQGTSAGQTYITGGFSGQSNSTTTLNGNSYYISGGMNFTSDTSFTLNAGSASTPCGHWTTATCFIETGGASLTNGAYTFANGVYYWWGPTNSSGTVTGQALTLNTPTFSLGGGTYYVNGGAVFEGGTKTVTVGQGTYFFAGYNASTPGLDDKDSNITFTGGTYFFNGGLSLDASGTITFGPGIYYINNGPLLVSGSGAIVANNATFVLEGSASYNFSGGGSINITAPTSSCMSYSQYPQAAYSASFPYDGTNGEGICGIAIYQPSTDSAADFSSIPTTITGTVYTPAAPLTVDVGSSPGFRITSNAMPSLVAESLTDNNSGIVSFTENNQSGASSSGGSPSSALLVQ